MARYALVIGIANYNNFRNLPKAVTDAENIAQVLREHGRFNVQPLPDKLIKGENCKRVAPDKKLTGKELGLALREFLLKKAKNHEALIYFAGHGFEAPTLTGKQKGYLATFDCTSDGQNAISFDDFNDLIQKSELSSLVVLLDCCYSGSFLEKIRSSFPDFYSKQDYCLITASREFEKAREDVEGGIFTQAVLRGLSHDKADEATGEVNVADLFSFISRELKQSGQEPINMGGGRSIPLVWYPPKKAVLSTEVSEECPYRGLEAFDKQHVEFFFGRSRIVSTIQQKLELGLFVKLIGTSGSGKSSVVRAGLIPKLEDNGWKILEPIIPGRRPLAKLETVFQDFFQGSKKSKLLNSFIDNDPHGLSHIRDHLPKNERFLLLIDQFEEIFTLCTEEDERRRFIELLTQYPLSSAFGKEETAKLAVITTMRADFIEESLRDPSLAQLIQEQAVYMPPLVGADLEQAITEPAKKQGYQLETGLLGAILKEISQEKECLPLLQFALLALWEKRDHTCRLLTLEQYEKLGGLTGALNQHAEQVYHYRDYDEEMPANRRDERDERDEPEKDWIRRIFLRLVITGQQEKDTRQRQSKGRLLAMGNDDSETHKALGDVLEDLIKARLLVAGKEDQQEEWIDLSHEALINGWERYAEWLLESRKLRYLRDRLENAQRLWVTEGRKDEDLIRGTLLAKLRANWNSLISELDSASQEFYQKCDINETQISVVMVESDLRKQAGKALSLLSIDPMEGLSLAIQALYINLERSPTKLLDLVEESFCRSVEAVLQVQEPVYIHEEDIVAMSFSPDGRFIVSSSDCTLKLWDLKNHLISKTLKEHEDSVNAVIFSPNSKIIASASFDKTIRLWSLQDNSTQILRGHNKFVNTIAFSPNGNVIASGGADSTIRLWNVSSGAPILILPKHEEAIKQGHEGAINTIAFSPDGNIIASGGLDSTIRLWNVSSGAPILILPKHEEAIKQGHKGAINTIAFSPDGNIIASGGADSTIRLWNVSSGVQISILQGHEGAIYTIAFSPNGNVIASGGADSSIRLWNTTNQKIEKLLKGHKGAVNAVTFSTDGTLIASGGFDQIQHLWGMNWEGWLKILYHYSCSDLIEREQNSQLIEQILKVYQQYHK
ncbi:MAG: caspase family protein [Scytonema hyalinum WJT4-NPBG1]|jgi:energy-coupling factor transporter ATP-binding protein EcfA2|nr:caspase family protein [Scytonema hyalinum WJT4-NPBG1]